ncbi:MAG: hypothetical protein ACE145_19370 [Terriglobia bacterium]
MGGIEAPSIVLASGVAGNNFTALLLGFVSTGAQALDAKTVLES